MKEITNLNFDGYALGGLAIGEPRDIPEDKMFYSCTGCELKGKSFITPTTLS